MIKATSIFNFSIFSLVGASIGFVISLLFLNDDDKSVNDELSDIAFSYNYAVEKASPAVVNIYSEQIIDSQLLNQRQAGLKRSCFMNQTQQASGFAAAISARSTTTIRGQNCRSRCHCQPKR